MALGMFVSANLCSGVCICRVLNTFNLLVVLSFKCFLMNFGVIVVFIFCSASIGNEGFCFETMLVYIILYVMCAVL